MKLICQEFLGILIFFARFLGIGQVHRVLSCFALVRVFIKQAIIAFAKDRFLLLVHYSFFDCLSRGTLRIIVFIPICKFNLFLISSLLFVDK